MEENNNNSNEYTGEYGNSVEAGDNPPSSLYSYSYKDNQSEATRSGDYYANENSNQSAEDQASFSDKVENFSQEEQWEKTPEQNEQQRFTQYGPPRDQDDQSQSNQYDSLENQDEQKRSTQYDRPQNRGGYTYNSQPNKGSSGISWKKVGACAGLAVVFGLVAAICFQGVSYISNHVLGINTAAIPIEQTTDHVKYTNAVTGTAIGTADVSGIAQNTMPSIVAITSTQEGQKYYDLFGQQYQGDDVPSCGSGFIVGKNDTELLIATNNHVIDGAKTISVKFIDEEVYEAKTKGSDSSADLAVIAVKLADIKSSTLKKIKIATLGDSSEAKVGEMVVAIGNALGYGQSVTVGYISAKDREITETSEDGSTGNTIKVIQTDAAINPGNSGGALLNMQGEVIAINSAKIADSSVEGVGYAIPISEATPIIDELMNKEVLTDSEKGYLGISGRTVTEEAASFNMPDGVYVYELAKDGAAEKGGIKQGDIITAINDVQVTTIESLKEKANSYKKGTKVIITVKRNSNGEYVEKKIEVTLQGEDSLKSIPESTGNSYSDDSNGNSDNNGNDGNGGNNGNNGNNGSNGDNGNTEDGNSGNDSSDGWSGSFPFGFGN